MTVNPVASGINDTAETIPLHTILQVAVCLLAAPFWFNPQTFALDKTQASPAAADS